MGFWRIAKPKRPVRERCRAVPGGPSELLDPRQRGGGANCILVLGSILDFRLYPILVRWAEDNKGATTNTNTLLRYEHVLFKLNCKSQHFVFLTSVGLSCFFFLIQNNGQNAYCKDVSIPNFGVTARSISIKKSGSRTSEITYHSQQIEWTGSSLGGREKSWRIWRRGVDSGARSFLSLVPQPQQRTWASTPALHALHDGVLSQHSAPGLVRSCKKHLVCSDEEFGA
jgi:hypothetical protein